MKHDFKVGDRIIFYSVSSNRHMKGITAVINNIFSSGILGVEYADGLKLVNTGVHPKQCRKLVKKKKIKLSDIIKITISQEAPSIEFFKNKIQSKMPEQFKDNLLSECLIYAMGFEILQLHARLQKQIDELKKS